MLRVTVEVVPGGDDRRAEKIGSIEIENVADLEEVPLEEVPDYVAVLFGGDGREHNRCSVSGHRRSDGWQMLVVRVLGAFGYKS